METSLRTNRITETFKKKTDILNIYFTAGYPHLNDTLRIAGALEQAGADILEIGIPFSDPIADGPTIQDSSQIALENGMTVARLFDQLKHLREQVSIPVLLMGYVNPILQFGVEAFCDKCAEVGVDGVIIPDLPMQEYIDLYQDHFKSKGIFNIFLISPNTSTKRIQTIEKNSDGFLYVVSSSSTTGVKESIQEGQDAYFERIRSMHLQTPQLVGFGISSRQTFRNACNFFEGAIIGSAFIKQLQADASDQGISTFIQEIKKK